MNKAITRFHRTIKFLGIKICNTDEYWERVDIENTEPMEPFIITEYEKNKWQDKEE